MSSDESRRYTDREVGLVLKRAAELEEQRHHDAAGRGLTLQQLHDIGREVGLSADVLNDAVSELQGGGGVRHMSLLGPEPSTKVVRAVPGELSKEAMQRLVQVIEDKVAATGTVTEALGAVRWTTVPDAHRLSQTTQVAFTPTAAETQVQVTHRFASKFRAMLHLLPTAWGGMIGAAVAASMGAVALPAAGVVGGSAIVGGLIGRRIWHVLARRAQNRIDGLADQVATTATELVKTEQDA